MGKVVLIGLCALVTAVLAVVLVVGGLFAAYNDVPDRDGGRSMGFVFIVGPFVFAIGAVIGGVVAFRWLHRGADAKAARPLWRGLAVWSFGGLATLALAIAAVNFMTAGGAGDGLYALGFACAFASLSWLVARGSSGSSRPGTGTS